MTGKTKRQLRAEAVERLNSLGKYVQANSISWGLFGSEDRNMPPDELRDALVDLLTDPELPEGDALEELRFYAYDNRYDYDPLKDVFEVDEHLPELCGHVADMIERDYVQREHYDKLLAERDEWKAKAERGVTNLEWLYENDEQFAAYVRISGAVIKKLAPSYAHEWLMSKHVDDCGQNADMSENAPDCVRNDALPPENGVNDGADGSNDTREKLEADVDTALYGASMTDDGYITLNMVVRWLDRQAAITERECRDGRELPKGVAWPRFEDGALVKFGDTVDVEGSARMVEYITFAPDSYELNTEHESRRYFFGNPVKRPPFIAADGQPIEAGQVLYDESGFRLDATE